MDAQGFGHLFADGQHRIERRHRFLKDHGRPLAPHQSALALGQGQHIGVAEHGPA